MKRQIDRESLIWGGLLVLLGGMLYFQSFLDVGAWIWVAVLGAAGLGVYAVYATERKEWWMLIVSYTLLAIALLVALLTLEVIGDSYVAVFVLGVIAIPFLYAYLRGDQAQWWLLIPPYVLLAIGLMLMLIEVGIIAGEIVPAYVLLAVALPFFVVYLSDRSLWWALVPAVVLSIIAGAFLLAVTSTQYLVPAVLIIVGIAVLARQFTRPSIS